MYPTQETKETYFLPVMDEIVFTDQNPDPVTMKLKYTIMILVSTENERVQRGNSVIIIKS
jgi:hypothetical protein